MRILAGMDEEERVKEIVEFSIRGTGEDSDGSVKHWILSRNQIKTHLLFSIFRWGTLFSLDPGLNVHSNFKSSLDKG